MRSAYCALQVYEAGELSVAAVEIARGLAIELESHIQIGIGADDALAGNLNGRGSCIGPVGPARPTAP